MEKKVDMTSLPKKENIGKSRNVYRDNTDGRGLQNLCCSTQSKTSDTDIRIQDTR